MLLGYVYVETKINDGKPIISSAGHFNCHGGALAGYKAHRPMQHAQGYSRSHWTPPLGNYSLRIAPAAAKATINKMTKQNTPTLLNHFDDHCDVSVQYRAHCLMQEVHGFTRSHWTLPLGESLLQYYQSDMPSPVFCDVFHRQLVKKGLELTFRPLLTIGVSHIKMMRTT